MLHLLLRCMTFELTARSKIDVLMDLPVRRSSAAVTVRELSLDT